MTYKQVKEHGEYLGFCPQKGYLYSVYMGDGKYLGKAYQEYVIVYIANGDVSFLIDHKVYI